MFTTTSTGQDRSTSRGPTLRQKDRLQEGDRLLSALCLPPEKRTTSSEIKQRLNSHLSLRKNVFYERTKFLKRTQHFKTISLILISAICINWIRTLHKLEKVWVSDFKRCGTVIKFGTTESDNLIPVRGKTLRRHRVFITAPRKTEMFNKRQISRESLNNSEDGKSGLNFTCDEESEAERSEQERRLERGGLEVRPQIDRSTPDEQRSPDQDIQLRKEASGEGYMSI